MIKFVQFELKKIIKSTYFKALLIALSLFVVALYVFVYLNAKDTIDNLVTGHEMLLADYEIELQENLDLIESGDFDVDEVQDFKYHNRFIESSMDSYKRRLQALQDKNWSALLEQQIEEDEEFLSFQLTGTESTGLRFNLRTRIERNRLILSEQIEPILPIDYSITLYTFYESDTPDHIKAVKKGAMKYSASGLYFLYILFGLSFSGFGVVFFLFLFGDILTKEEFGRDGPIHLLNTLPIKRYKVLFGKLLALIMATIFILLIMCGISLLSSVIFDRFGDGSYPILIYEAEIMFTFMNLSTFIMKSLVLFFLVLLFSYSLLLLFSVLIKRTLPAIGATLIVTFVGIEISSDKYLTAIFEYIPFNYFSAQKVISKETAFILDNYNVTYFMGIWVLIVSIIAISFITGLLYKIINR